MCMVIEKLKKSLTIQWIFIDNSVSAFHWYATEWRKLPLAATTHHRRHVISHQSVLCCCGCYGGGVVILISWLEEMLSVCTIFGKQVSTPKYTVLYWVCIVKTSVELRPERCRGEIMLCGLLTDPPPVLGTRREQFEQAINRSELFLAVADWSWLLEITYQYDAENLTRRTILFRRHLFHSTHMTGDSKKSCIA